MLLVTPSLELALGAVAFLTPVAPRPTPIAPDTTKASSPNLPLAASRSFALSTSKGTWISLDLSPDGRTIVFDLLGDLYTIPAQGGRATRLTSGLAYDAQPRFSPDGKRIVFVSDRSGVDNLWLMSVDGRDTTQLTKDKTPSNTHYLSPEWTPDGKGIVATKESDTGGPGKLWLYDPDGGTGLELVGAPPANRMLGAAFGPDSRYVWYATRAGAFDYNAIFPLWQVAVYDRASGTRTVMTSRYGSGFRPALSPDGKWLTYGSRQGPNTGLILRELATGPEKWLADPIQRDEQESFAPLAARSENAKMPTHQAMTTVASHGRNL